MKLTKRNGVFYLDWRDPMGKRKRVSTGKRERHEAERVASDIMAGRDTRGGQWTLAMAMDHALKHVWADSKSWQTFYSNAKIVKRDLGHLGLDEVTYDRLQDWAKHCRDAGQSPATVNRRLSGIRRALVEAERRGQMKGVPGMPTQIENNKRLRWLTEREEELLYRACDKLIDDAAYMKDVIVFLIRTGARISEMMKMRPAHINQKSVRFEGTKSKSGTYKARTVPLALLAYDPAVTIAKRNADGTAWTYDQLIKRLRKVTRAAGLHDVTFHTFRHTCASRLVQRGADIYRVQDWLGHSSVTVTERYAHLQEGRLDDMAELLDDPVMSTSGHSANNVTPLRRKNFK